MSVVSRKQSFCQAGAAAQDKRPPWVESGHSEIALWLNGPAHWMALLWTIV